MIVPDVVTDEEAELDEILPRPAAAVTDQREAPDTSAVAASNPLRNADGSPIGLQRYCELITPVYRWDWPHMRLVCAALDRVQRGEVTRLLIELPPRHGKTAIASVRFPAYLLELDPTTRIISAAHGDDLANDISRQTRRLISGRVPLARDRNAVAEWETQAGGAYRAKGAGAGTAGLPADYFLVDDPFGNALAAYSQATRTRLWNWFIEDVYTRLESGGRLVVTMTRRHEDDIVGRIKASDEAADWEVVRLPALAEEHDALGRKEGQALWPEKFTEAYFEKVRRRGEITFSSLYQQRPAPAKGFIFQSDWFRFYTTRDHPIIENGVAVPFLPDRLTEQLQSWDMSFKDKAKSDFVAGHAWGRLGANCYLLERDHGRKDMPATIKAVRAMTQRRPAAALKLVEDKANGPAVIATLRNEIPGLVGVEPEGDKVSRAYAVTSIFESGNVWLPHPGIAPWVEGYKLELLQFPRGAKDDDVDATTQALRRLMKHIENETSRTDARPRGGSYATHGV